MSKHVICYISFIFFLLLLSQIYTLELLGMQKATLTEWLLYFELGYCTGLNYRTCHSKRILVERSLSLYCVLTRSFQDDKIKV